MDKHPIQGGVEILQVILCYRNLYKLGPDLPLGMCADLTLQYIFYRHGIHFIYFSLTMHDMHTCTQAVK